MMNLMAGAFTGFGMLLGSLFGGHHGPPPQLEGSTTPRQHEGPTTLEGHMGLMGTSTQERMNANKPPAILGKVVSISGTTLTVTGRENIPMMKTGEPVTATSTYTVDASGAKIIKFGRNVSSSTPITVENISQGDAVLVIGTVSGTDVTATTVVDGFTTVRKPLPPAEMPMNKNHMATTTRNKK